MDLLYNSRQNDNANNDVKAMPSNPAAEKSASFVEELLKLPVIVQRKLRNLLGSLDPAAGEYVSHQSALLLQNMLFTPLTQLTFVTSKSRKPVVHDGFAFKPVFHDSNRPRKIVMFRAGGMKFPVSTPEMTLVDIISDSACSPAIESVAKLFAVFTGKKNDLLHLAGSVSDSALKRCLFWLLWAGRLSKRELVRFKPAKTPVLLDRRYQKDDLVWDSLTGIHFPAGLLAVPVDCSAIPEPEEDSGWRELRRFGRFCEFCCKKRWLPVLGDTRPRNVRRLNEFFSSRDVLQRLSSQDGMLMSIFKGKTRGAASPDLPDLCLKNLKEMKNLHELIPDFRNQVLKLVENGTFEELECGIYFAWRQKMKKVVVEALEKRGMELVRAEAYETISWLLPEILQTEKDLPPEIFRLSAMVYRRNGRYDEALTILSRALSEAEGRENRPAAFADLYLSMGSVLFALKRYAEGHQSLVRAASIFQQYAPEKTGGVWLMYGNLEFARGNMQTARNRYLRALREFKQYERIEHCAKAFYNLALVEFRRSKYSQAGKLFKMAAEIYVRLQAHDSAGQAEQGAAMAMINTGQTAKAIKYLSELRSRQLLNPSTCPDTLCITLAMLVWAYQIAGFSFSASQHAAELEKIDETRLSERAWFIKKLFLAISSMLTGRFPEAIGLLDQIIDAPGFARLTPEDRSEAFFRKGQALLSGNDRDGIEFLKKATETSGGFGERDQALRLRLFLGLNDVAVADDVAGVERSSVQECLEKLNTTRNFDPFWPWYAKPLVALNSEAASDYLRFHLKKTTGRQLQRLMKILPGLKCIVDAHLKKNCRQKNALLIAAGGSRVLSPVESQKWRNSSSNFLCIDGQKGVVRVDGRFFQFRKTSLPFRLFIALIQGFPEVPVARLFQEVWGIGYDPEWDLEAFKAAIYRLRKLLESAGVAIRLSLSSHCGERTVKIAFCRPWQALI